MRHARRGRRNAAPFILYSILVLAVAALSACVALAGQRASPDRITSLLAGIRVELTPQVAVPAGSDVTARLAVLHVADRPITRNLRIVVTDTTGLPIDGAMVVVVGDMRAMTNSMLIQTSARSEGGGTYVAHLVLPMTGTYEMQLIVTGPNSVGSVRFDLDVAG